jgi:hypothetical protein
MAETNGLKMPDDYTEFTYEDGEQSGSGHRRWSAQDTRTVLGWTIIVGSSVVPF